MKHSWCTFDFSNITPLLLTFLYITCFIFTISQMNYWSLPSFLSSQPNSLILFLIHRGNIMPPLYLFTVYLAKMSHKRCASAVMYLTFLFHNGSCVLPLSAHIMRVQYPNEMQSLTEFQEVLCLCVCLGFALFKTNFYFSVFSRIIFWNLPQKLSPLEKHLVLQTWQRT